MKRGLPPVFRKDARVLILGSLPGDMSLAARRYYAHPRNQFWHLAGAVLNRSLADLDYEPRLGALCDGGIALWDVVAAGMRRGSLDQDLAAASLNDVTSLVRNLPHIRAIAFNGLKAAQLASKMAVPTGITTLTLPSSSAANCLRIDEKMNQWRRLTPYLEMVSPAGFEPATY